MDDLRLVKTNLDVLSGCLEQLEGAAPAETIDFKPLVKVVGQLITFITKTAEPDPLKREGLPIFRRQIMVREQLCFDTAMQFLTRPFVSKFSRDDLTPSGTPTPKQGQLKKALLYCMVFCRHALRDCSPNKRDAMRFVQLLQQNLGLGIRTAEVLREVFADNAEMLDLVTDDIVERFVNLIRETGREARYIDFLLVLCQCLGKAVRPNQWLVCQLLVQKAPELLFRLNLRTNGSGAAEVYISGDPTYFPAFQRSSELPLAEWLSITTPTNASYFANMMELLALLVRGRNLKNVDAVRAMLPYQLVEAAITSPALNKDFLHVVRQFVVIAIDAYIDHEPHELMTRVKTVRIWTNIERAAESGRLSSRLTTQLPIDWKQFDGLKEYLLNYISGFHHQIATQVEQNKLVLLLLQAAFQLLRFGFYSSFEVAKLIPNFLSVLDGRGDSVGLPGIDAQERYEKRVDNSCNTLVIMECKMWCCRVLSLVCTMRVDIRLSKLLAQYKADYDSGKWSTKTKKKKKKGLLGFFGGNKDASQSAKTKDGYVALADEDAPGKQATGRRSSSMAHKTSSMAHKTGNPTLFDLLSLEADITGDGKSDLVPTLLDLTFYDHPELVNAAIELVVRHFQQRNVLHQSGVCHQGLVPPPPLHPCGLCPMHCRRRRQRRR